MKVLLMGYFFKNFGDDLMVKNICEKYPYIDFEIIKTNKKMQLDHLEKINNIKVKDCSGIKNTLNKVAEISNILLKKSEDLNFNPHIELIDYNYYDAYVEIGGSIFSEKTGFKEYPYILLKRRMNISNSIMNGFFIGCNFGPYDTDLYVELHRKLFSNINDICFRDRKSYNLFKDMENVRFAYDSVLSLDYDYNHNDEKKYNIISIMNFKDSNKINYLNYENLIIDLIKEYIKHNENVKLMSFNGSENDEDVIDRLFLKLSNKERESVSHYCYTGEMDKALDIFANSKSIIATRYHSFILALLFDIPFFTLVYDQKTKNTLEDLNIDKYIDLKSEYNYDLSLVVDNIKRYDRRPEIIENSKKQFEAFDRFVNKFDKNL